jgi:hypothetical protein
MVPKFSVPLTLLLLLLLLLQAAALGVAVTGEFLR